MLVSETGMDRIAHSSIPACSPPPDCCEGSRLRQSSSRLMTSRRLPDAELPGLENPVPRQPAIETSLGRAVICTSPGWTGAAIAGAIVTTM